MKITHPTTRSANVGGQNYHADADGVMEVPDAAAHQLLSPCHGFTRVAEQKRRPKAKEPEVSPPPEAITSDESPAAKEIDG